MAGEPAEQGCDPSQPGQLPSFPCSLHTLLQRGVSAHGHRSAAPARAQHGEDAAIAAVPPASLPPEKHNALITPTFPSYATPGDSPTCSVRTAASPTARLSACRCAAPQRAPEPQRGSGTVTAPALWHGSGAVAWLWYCGIAPAPWHGSSTMAQLQHHGMALGAMAQLRHSSSTALAAAHGVPVMWSCGTRRTHTT